MQSNTSQMWITGWNLRSSIPRRLPELVTLLWLKLSEESRQLLPARNECSLAILPSISVKLIGNAIDTWPRLEPIQWSCRNKSKLRKHRRQVTKAVVIEDLIVASCARLFLSRLPWSFIDAWPDISMLSFSASYTAMMLREITGKFIRFCGDIIVAAAAAATDALVTNFFNSN